MLGTVFIPANVNIKVAALYGFSGGVLGLILLFVAVYVIHLILALKRQRDEIRKLWQPIEELAQIKPGDVIKGKDINVSLMFQQLKSDNLVNVTFEHCTLRGPCTVVIEGNCNFNSCNFGSNFPSKLIRGETGKRYFGIGVFVHSTFNFCEFANLSFLLSEDQIKKLLEKVVQM